MLEDSAGRRNGMFTCAWVTLHVVLFRVLMAGITIGSVTFTGIDAGLAGVLLSATLGAYVARRNQLGVKTPSQSGEVK